jgi:hypothetical protein
MLKKISEHWGGPEYPGRRAEIYHDTDKNCFTVHFYKKRTVEDLVEERDMVTDGVVHSSSYAEDAAENWCLGYMP